MASTPAPASALSSEVYGVFCGSIDQGTVQRIFSGLTNASANNVRHIHLLFQSNGGTVGDGVCLYNFFKSFPIPITVYNVGAVQSIAVIAYLGAKIRKTSARALFMLHRTSSPPQAALAVTLKGIAKSLTLDDQRTESILKENITLLGDEQWSNLDYYDFFFSGEEAIKIGLAHEIGEFSPPPGAQVYIV
jgi:ATP-dependent Clp protease, protease subunit